MQKLTKVYEIKGKPIRVFSRRFLARMMGKSVRSISRWTTNGVTPPPLFTYGDPFNWYTPDEIEIWVRAYSLDDVRAGVPIDGSYFSITVHAETQALRDRIENEDPHFLNDAMNLEKFVLHIKQIRELLDWKKQRPLRGERRKRKEWRY